MDVQIHVGGDAEELVDLIKHFPVLAGDHNDGAEPGVVVEGMDKRRHFDGFGSRPVNEHDVNGIGRRIIHHSPSSQFLRSFGFYDPLVMFEKATAASSVYSATFPDG